MRTINAILKMLLVVVLLAFHLESYAQNYSPYGAPFTPKGDLRILVIFAGLDAHCNPADPYYSIADWPQVQTGYPNCKTFPTNYQSLFYSSNASFSPTATDNSISNYFYQASRFHPTNPPLRIVADYFPEKINISSSNYNNGLVFQQIQANYPNFDWSKYDNRTNNPNFLVDNSASSPDHKLDFVVVIWRNGWGAGGLASVGNYTFTTNINGYPENYTVENGFTNTVGFRIDADIKPVFYHEMAHVLFYCPHYNGANGALGKRFFLSDFDNGMMANGSSVPFCNAFESWVCGWTEIKHDLSTYTQNGNYTLGDFITTGQSIRIKIPNTTDQFLWIENHQKVSNFDHKPWTGGLINSPPGSYGIADTEPGIYMYLENVLDSRSNIYTYMYYNMDKVNGMKNINASGNYDYAKPTQHTINGWGNFMYHFDRGAANPMGGINSHILYRNDFGFTANQLENCTSYNNCSNHESYAIMMENINGTYKALYGNKGGRNQDAINAGHRSDAFQAGDLITIGSNPPIINLQKYSTSSNRLDPILLNGLSINVVSLSSGVYTLDIRFNETNINSDVRWSGDFILNNVPGVASNYDLSIQPGVTLTLNKSGTPNRYTMLNGELINLTTFSVANGAYMHLDNGAKVIADNSKLTVESGGTLELKSNAHLQAINSGLIHIKSGATVILQANSRVEILNSSNICIETGANIVFNDLSAHVIINGDYFYGSISPTLGSALTVSNAAIPTGVNYHSSIVTDNNAYFTTGTSVLRASTTITIGPNTDINPSSGSFLIAYVNPQSFNNNCTTVSNYRLAYQPDNNTSGISPEGMVCGDQVTGGSGGESNMSNSYSDYEVPITIYPNPTEGFVRIETEGCYGVNFQSIKLYNASGIQVSPASINLTSDIEARIDISNLKAGVYLIKLDVNGRSVERKIIKNKN